MESANKFGVSKFAKDVLDVADNLSRAAECVPVEARASDAQPALKALYEGVVMTDAVLLKTFEKHGASSSARLSGPPPTYTYSHPTHTHTSPTHTSSTHHPLPHTHTPESMPASHCHPRAHPQPSLAWQVS